MNTKYSIVSLENPVWEVIGGGITTYNDQQAGESNEKLLCFALQDKAGQVVGGIIGATHWDWFYINLMWIQPDLRHQGYGRKLLQMAEAEAIQRGAKHAYLDTFTFQAPAFYEKQGYEVFGTLKDFPAGHTRYYYKKDL